MLASNKIWNCFKNTLCCSFSDQPEADGRQQQVLEDNPRCSASTAESLQADDLLCCSLDLPSREVFATWHLLYEKPVQDLSPSDIEEELNWSLKRNKELINRVHELEDFICSKTKDADSQNVSSSCGKLQQQLERSLKEKRQLEGRAQKAEENIKDLKHEIAILQKRLQQAENLSPGSFSSVMPSLPLPPATGSIRSHVSTRKHMSMWNEQQIAERHREEDSLTTVSGGSFHAKQHAMTQVLEKIRHGVSLKPVTSHKKVDSSPSVLTTDMRDPVQERGQQETQVRTNSPLLDLSLEALGCPFPLGQGEAQGDTDSERKETECIRDLNCSLRKIGSPPVSNGHSNDSNEDSTASTVLGNAGFNNIERAPTAMEGSMDHALLQDDKLGVLGPSNGNCPEELLQTTLAQETILEEWPAVSLPTSIDLNASFDQEVNKMRCERAWDNVTLAIQPMGISEDLAGPRLGQPIQSRLIKGDGTDPAPCPESIMRQKPEDSAFAWSSLLTNKSMPEEEHGYTVGNCTTSTTTSVGSTRDQ